MDYARYIKPELLILVPVLVIIGKLIKGTIIDSKHIPLILGVISVILSCAYLFIESGENIAQSLLTGFIQGVLLAGTAVYGNQIFRQYFRQYMK